MGVYSHLVRAKLKAHFLCFRALARVIVSAYSNELPEARPRARRVMVTLNDLSSPSRYRAVVSPWVLGLVARIISMSLPLTD